MTVRRNLVLDVDGEPEIFVGAVERALTAVRKRSGLFFMFAGSESLSPTIDVYHWRERLRDGGLVTFVDDRATPARYVEVEMDDGAGLEALQDTLPVVSLPVLKQRSAAPDGDPAALVRLALASRPEPDAAAVSLIEAGLGSDDPARLDAAVMAAALTHWQGFLPSLERVRERTGDDAIRRLAGQAIANCGGTEIR